MGASLVCGAASVVVCWNSGSSAASCQPSRLSSDDVMPFSLDTARGMRPIVRHSECSISSGLGRNATLPWLADSCTMKLCIARAIVSVPTTTQPHSPTATATGIATGTTYRGCLTCFKGRGTPPPAPAVRSSSSSSASSSGVGSASPSPQAPQNDGATPPPSKPSARGVMGPSSLESGRTSLVTGPRNSTRSKKPSSTSGDSKSGSATCLNRRSVALRERRSPHSWATKRTKSTMEKRVSTRSWSAIT